LHFWVGSFCCILDNNYKPAFPKGVIAVSDIITLIEDMGNQIPDKSWMLYLLELFNKQIIPAELNLICSFNMEDALWTEGLRKKLEQGKRRHEFQADHGFRK
jgi:hypothetical protein